MKYLSSLLISLSLALILCGCFDVSFLEESIKALAPDDDEVFAEESLEAVRTRDFTTVTERFDPQFVTEGFEDTLEMVAKVMDHGEPVDIKLIGCNLGTFGGKRRTTLVYQYEFTNAWLTGNVIIDTKGNTKRLYGLHVNPLEGDLAVMNAFTLKGKTLIHYLMLVFLVGIPLFILVTLVICARTKLKRRKWLWIIFIITGLGQIGLNWTTGEILFNPLTLYFQFFGSSVLKQGLYAPWIITISVPLGAIMFLIQRKQLIAPPPPLPCEAEPIQE